LKIGFIEEEKQRKFVKSADLYSGISFAVVFIVAKLIK